MSFYQYKRLIKVSGVVLAVGLLLVTFKLREGHRVSKGSYYTVVFDCGSTGTRVNVYEWVAKDAIAQFAEKIVPFERHKGTPIFVLATSGLRRSWIRVLSGKEEAYYGWVALNYKMEIFRNQPMSPILELLDLGGLSLQVVIEVDNPMKEDKDTHLMSHTEALRESPRGILELRCTCFSPGFMQNYTCYGCFGLNVVSDKENNNELHKVEYPSLYLVGVPNWEQCKALARTTSLNLSHLDWPSIAGEDYSGGLLNLTTFAHPSAHFHALFGFFAIYDKLNLSPKANLTRVWEKGQHVCSKSWADKSSVSGNQYYTAHYYFRAPYMAFLIEDSLCLNDKEIFFGPADVSWTLIAAFVEGEYLWLFTTTSLISTLNLHVKFMSSPIFVFVVLVCLLLIVYRSQFKLPMLSKRDTTPGASLHFYFHQR
ncbi:hypothetical protein G4B88_018335 [Cannabis sativa]|uniref:Uncharacterized protein n=1 Tax=Cannabis sativa TaxID=3483 RepID=A0A7J6EWA7_CANSA|nr:hypothetical protein G4B88_018335 [Cannabis sativa]